MNKKILLLSTTAILFMVFSKPVKQVQAVGKKSAKIVKKYSLSSLLTSVVLLQESFKSNDYFNQFMELDIKAP